jgi:Ca2+-binding EF-hand superfamily protein
VDAEHCGKCGEKHSPPLPDQMLLAYHAVCPQSVDLNLFSRMCDICEQRAGLTHWGFKTLRFLFHEYSKEGHLGPEGLRSVLALDYSNCISDCSADEELVKSALLGKKIYHFFEFLYAMREHREPGVTQALAVFNDFDVEQKGYLDSNNVTDAIEALGFCTASPKLVCNIAKENGIGNGQRMSFDDFWRLLQHFSKQCGMSSADVAFIRDTFNQVDDNGSGSIDSSELRFVMRILGFPASYERLHQLQEEFDTDGSGELEFDELLRLVAKYREKEMKIARESFETLAGDRNLADLSPRCLTPSQKYARRLSGDHPHYKDQSDHSHDTSDKSQIRRMQTFRQDFEHVGRDETIPISDLRKMLHGLGYTPSKEQEAALAVNFDEGATDMRFWELMNCVEQFRTWAREEFQQHLGFTELQLEGLRNKFESYDCDGNGYLKHAEVAKVLSDLYPDANMANHKIMEELLQVGEVNVKGHLDFDGYMRIMRSFHDRQDYARIQEEQDNLKELHFSRDEVIDLRQVFAIFDADASGSVSLDELSSLVSMIIPGLQRDDKLKELQKILHEVDTDGNRTLDFIEFLKLVRRLQDSDWQGFNEHVEQKSLGEPSKKA